MQHLRAHWPQLLELLILFGVLPVALVFTEDFFPLIPTLIIVAGVVIILLRVQGWQYRNLTNFGTVRAWRNMLLLFAVAALLFIGATMLFQPELFLAFPANRPGLWIMVMVLYPLLSALPQELMYREYFFFRYGKLFGENTWALILLSGFLFMWGHILFMNVFALSVTLVGGLLFAWRYYHTRSLILATVEHGLYGNLLFTLGFGQYIVSGMV